MQSALFNLGFRPFFLLGVAFAIVAMALWIGPLFPTAIIWHAHEMIYGFAVAVIAGFLLTAVRNWTGIMTLHGAPLAALAGLWLTARLLVLFPGTLIWAVTLNGLFLLFLLAAVFWPVYRVRQWRQWGVLSCLAFLLGGQILFLLGSTGILPDGHNVGIRVGLFAVGGLGGMIIGMICRVSLGHTGRDIHRPPSGPATHGAALATAAIYPVLVPAGGTGLDRGLHRFSVVVRTDALATESGRKTRLTGSIRSASSRRPSIGFIARSAK